MDRTGRRLRLSALLLCAAVLAACGGGGDSGGGTGGSGNGGGTGSGGSGGGSGGGTLTYTVGGAVSGLSGSGLVLQDNGGDDLALPAGGSGSFAFATAIAGGAKYAVTIKVQPTNPSQTCVLANASGTVGSANVANVAVTCTTNTFSVGGTVVGLTGTGLVLQSNGGDDLTVASNGSFTFGTSVASGADFKVSIKTSPSAPVQACAVTNGSGTVGSSPVTNIVVNCGPIALLAGRLGGSGSIDGVGGLARFLSPYGAAVDGGGNVYVADGGNHTIRKITPAGAVSTIAGSAGHPGLVDGAGSAARFSFPHSVATDTAGNVYVADMNNHAIRKITPGGMVSTLAGNGQVGSSDGAGSVAQFNNPEGVATDSTGNVYVADTDNQTIRKITPTGTVSTIAGTKGQAGSTDSAGGAPLFYTPVALTTDTAGNVYVADANNDTIRKITPNGAVSTLAGAAGQAALADGTGSAARFNYPNGIALDAAGNLYVTDANNHAIRRVTPAGDVTTLAGGVAEEGSVDGSGSSARFAFPAGVALDAAGNVYLADSDNNTVRKMAPDRSVSTFAGAAISFGSSDGTDGAAQFFYPEGLAADAQRNVYVADSSNHTIRKITPAGVVSTFAGKAGEHSATDGAGADARFFFPNGVVTDATGNLYVTDSNNHTIRKITAAGVVSTFAGTAGQSGSADGSGAAARFFYPIGIAIDAAGTLYVTDTNNQTIRKITTAGVVSTLAGKALLYGSTDGNGAAARFLFPQGIATDAALNVYVADGANHTIRKITQAGDVSTFVGSAGQSGSTDGLGTAARFYNPSGVVTDSAGNLYVADSGNHTIRRITPDGNVKTVVGVPGSQGIQLGPLPGSLNWPTFLAVLPGPGVTLVETDGENVVLQITLP